MRTHEAAFALLASARWPVVPFRRVTRLVREPNTDARAVPLSVSSQGYLYERALEGEGAQASSEETVRRNWLVEPGDIVVNPMWLAGGGVARSTMRGCVSPDYRVYRCDDRVDSRFLTFLLRTPQYFDQYSLYTRGATTFDRRVSRHDFEDLPVMLPDLGSQRRVADYLGEESQRIDTATLSLQRATALLHERAQAELEEVVLRPQGPHAPELGEWPSPDGWQRRSLVGLSSKFVDGDWVEAPYITDHGVRLLQTGNVGVGEFREQGGRFVSDSTFDDLRCTEVRPGDVLVCRLANPVGRACVAPDLGVRMITSVDVTIMRCGPDVEPAFVTAVLSTSSWLSRMAAEEQGSTRARIARTRLGEFRIPVPDIETQRQVAAAVREQRDATSRAAARLQREADLLTERKQALISAAVTGEITV
jgi:type I restriction enzyme S subunit